MAEITIRILAPGEPIPPPVEAVQTSSRQLGRCESTGSTQSLKVYHSKTIGPQRQSKRLTRTARRKERKLSISKQMSLKDIKLLVRTTGFVLTKSQR